MPLGLPPYMQNPMGAGPAPLGGMMMPAQMGGPMGGAPPMGMPGPMGGGGMPQGGGMPGMPPQTPIQTAGEDVITKLLQMAAANPQLLLGLSLAGAAREVSQLSGLSRRKQGGGGKTGQPMPPAQALLSGNQGDLDRLMALQQMLGGGAGAQAAPLGTGGPGGPRPGPMAGPAMSPMLQMLQPQSTGVV